MNHNKKEILQYKISRRRDERVLRKKGQEKREARKRKGKENHLESGFLAFFRHSIHTEL